MTSETPDMQAVLERLERLERQSQRLKQVGIVVLVAVAALVLMGQATPKSRTVEANEFVVRDASGKLRAWLGTDLSGPRFVLYDGSGLARLDLATAEERSDITLSDANGKVRLSLSVQQHHHLPNNLATGLPIPNWAIHPEKDLETGYPTDSGVALDFYDEGSGEIAMLHGDSGVATLGLADKDETGVILLSAHRGGPSVRLYDTEGFRTFLGTAELVTPATGETHKTSAASLVMLDKEGKVVSRAP